MFSNFFTTTKKNFSREVSFANGDTFKDMNCMSTFQPKGRRKMVMKTSSKPLMSIHLCARCSMKDVPRGYMHVYHLKTNIPGKARIICNSNTFKYYEKHKQMVKTINSAVS